MHPGTRDLTHAAARGRAITATVLRSAIVILAPLVSMTASPALAQSAAAPAVAQHGWVAATLGAGTGNLSFAGALSFWYARNALALGVEGSSEGGILGGEQRDVVGVMAGVTRATIHHRLVAAAGLASVHDHESCEDFCSPAVPESRNIAVAFSGQAFVNASVIGIGLETFGAVGSGRSSFIAAGLSVQLGWLSGSL